MSVYTSSLEHHLSSEAVRDAITTRWHQHALARALIEHEQLLVLTTQETAGRSHNNLYIQVIAGVAGDAP